LANKLLLFDIDGTLLRAENAAHLAIDRSFQDIFGNDRATKDISFFGRTDPELFQDAAVKILGRRMDNEEYTALVKLYLTFLPEELERCTFHLMPGVEELLLELSAREEVLLGLQTGNLEPSAYMKLKRGNIDHFFHFGPERIFLSSAIRLMTSSPGKTAGSIPLPSAPVKAIKQRCWHPVPL
jgi:phosphoglycolate phosphatase